MKKIVALLLSVTFLFSLAACNKTTEETTESTTAVVDPQAPGFRETTELFDGAYALDYTFEDPENFPWTTYTEGGALTLVCEDGKMIAKIENPGVKKHSCQVYHDGFQIYQNAEYQVDFDIWGDVERDFEWRIQINGSDYHAYYVEEAAHMGTEPTHITAVFTMYEPSDPAPRFAFNLGAAGDGAHNVYIDNLTMQVLNCSNAVAIEGPEPPNPVALNQVGYRPNDPKTVFIASPSDTSFDIVKADTGDVVYSGTLSDPYMCRFASYKVAEGDFSDFKEPGTYIVKTANSGESYSFIIADNVYDDALRASILMIYTQRCGCEVTTDIGEEYKDFAHPACHTDIATVYGTDKKIDVTGGWHDAGDYGRYVVPGAKTIADLLMTYEDTGFDADDLGIPESGNEIPDLLDEARYELEWMFKMQDENGGVYHKVTCANFPDTVMPQEETAELLVMPVSTTATGDFAAVMARASVVYAPFDEEFSLKCLEASKRAYDYMLSNASSDTTGYLNPTDVATGEYPDAVNQDEFFWAAIELFVATGEQSYLDKAKELYNSNMELGLGWIEMGLYGIHTYLLSDASAQDTAFTKELKDRIIEEMDKSVMLANREGYFNKMSSFPWGSNLTISNNGILYNLGYMLTGNEEYKTLMYYQVDYILGMNACGYCFLTGFGEHAAQFPHHRPSQFNGHAVPGMVVGGPNGDPADPYAMSVLYDTQAALCYVDNDTAYSINEVAIYWNSPFIYILAAKVQS